MEKRIIFAMLVLSFTIILMGVLYYALHIEHETIKQEYEWAMEMSKIGIEERKEIIMAIKNQILV